MSAMPSSGRPTDSHYLATYLRKAVEKAQHGFSFITDESNGDPQEYGKDNYLKHIGFDHGFYRVGGDYVEQCVDYGWRLGNINFCIRG
jgi:hypothetical protein